MSAMNPFTALYDAITGNLYRGNAGYKVGSDLSGKTQRDNTQSSLQAQIEYERYLAEANRRALEDWNRNVGSKGRSIRYPEFSYAGQIYRANTSVARAGFDYSTADANYYGNLPYRGAGLYGIAGRFSRYL